MTAPPPNCSVCGKPVVSHDGAAKVGREVIHAGCYPAAKAKRDAETRAASRATVPQSGLLRRLLRRRKGN
jgi:hypothetical protein